MVDIMTYKKMKVQELRDACEENGLDSTGIKAVLLERLEEALEIAETVQPVEDEELEDIPDEDNTTPDAGHLVDLDTDNDPACTAPDDSNGLDDLQAVDLSKALKPHSGTTSVVDVNSTKIDTEFDVRRTALVAAIEADLEKRKARADRFGIAWELSAIDIERLECAKRGLPLPGSKGTDSDGRKPVIPKKQHGNSQTQSEKGGRAARFGVDLKLRGTLGQKTDVCRNCGKKGHWARDCWAPGGGAEAKNKRPSMDVGRQNQHQKEKRKPEARADVEDMKRSRGDRFGFGIGVLTKDPEFEAKLAARAARFAEK